MSRTKQAALANYVSEVTMMGEHASVTMYAGLPGVESG